MSFGEVTKDSSSLGFTFLIQRIVFQERKLLKCQKKCDRFHYINHVVFIIVCRLGQKMFVCLLICLFVCLLICLLICLFVCLLICLFVCLLICLFVCLLICLFVYLSVCLLIYLFVCLLICLSVNLSVCLSVNLSVCPFVYLLVSLVCLSVVLSVLSVFRWFCYTCWLLFVYSHCSLYSSKLYIFIVNSTTWFPPG